MKKIKIYVASPYTNGWMPDNVRLQIEAQHILLDNGFVTFIPLLSHFSELYKSRSHEDWLQLDLEWLKLCNILIRIKSSYNNIDVPSPGADKEVEVAIENSIPIYIVYSLNELKEWAENFNKNEFLKTIYK